MALNAGTQNFKINSSNDNSTITILGGIGESWFSDGYTMQNVKEDLSNISTPKIDLIVSSQGGSVADALTIHDLLKMNKAEVSSKILGATASAGTLVSQAADPGKLQMSKNSMHLVHPVMDAVIGNAKELRRVADENEKFDGLIVDIYSNRIGNKKTKDEIKTQMDKEEWVSATDAKEFGFVDEVFTPGKESTTIDSFDPEKINACDNLPNISGLTEPTPTPNPTIMNDIANKFNSLKADFALGFNSLTSKLNTVPIALVDPAKEDVADIATLQALQDIKTTVDDMVIVNTSLTEKNNDLQTKHDKMLEAYGKLAIKHGHRTEIQSIDAEIQANEDELKTNEKAHETNATALRDE